MIKKKIIIATGGTGGHVFQAYSLANYLKNKNFSVKLTSDNGIVGYGEVYAGSVSPEVMEYVIKDVFDRHMKNEAPENIELMFRRVYSSGFSQRPDPTLIGAFSGLEMACLDILGKSIEKPIYSILGGCMQNKIRSYTYLYPLEHHNKEKFWSSPDMAVESAKKMLDLVRQHSRDQVIQHIRNLEYDLKNKRATTAIPLDLLIQMLEEWFSQDEETINDPSYREAK